MKYIITDNIEQGSPRDLHPGFESRVDGYKAFLQRRSLMNRKGISHVVFALVLSLLVVGGQALFANGASEKKVKNFAYFIPHQGNSFMAGLAQNMIDAGKAAGVNVKVYTARK